MIADDKITEIFCAVDEFCKEFDKQVDKKSLMSSDTTVLIPNRVNILSRTGVIILFVLFNPLNKTRTILSKGSASYNLCPIGWPLDYFQI